MPCDPEKLSFLLCVGTAFSYELSDPICFRRRCEAGSRSPGIDVGGTEPRKQVLEVSKQVKHDVCKQIAIQ